MKRLIILLAVIFVAVSVARGQKKSVYHAEWDLGINIGSPYAGFVHPTINTIHGVRFSDRVSVGGGLSVNYSPIYDGKTIMPLYANVKCFFALKKRTRPYVSFDIGYTMFLSNEGNDGPGVGVYFSPALGLKKGRFKFQIGYTAQQWKFTYDSSGSTYIHSTGHIRIGMMF
jgi:hypothetical protein